MKLFFLLFLLSFSTYSQIWLNEDWVHTTGIPDTVDYSACKVDGSGNVYVTTNTISATEKANILTTKYNSSGVVQWEVEKDNADENDYGAAIDVDGSGNVYVAAATWVDGTNKYDYMVIKYNSSGTQQWTATYNGAGNFYDIPTDIFVDGSGNVYVTGGSYGSGTLSDFCTIKYNSSGSAQWTSRYNYASYQDIAAIIKQAPSGRIYIVGASENTPGSWDFAAVKYNQSTGAQLAVNRNSASGSGFDEVFSADIDADGNIYLSGRAAVVDEGFNMRTVKIDTTLSVVWARNRDNVGLDDEAHGVIVDNDDNVYVTGWVTNDDETKSFLTLKYNSSGTLQWYKKEDAPNAGLDAYSLKISSVVGGNIAVAGNIDNGNSLDFLTVIYDSDGDRLWMEQYDSPDKADDKVNYVKADVDGIFYVGGKSYSVSTATNRLIKYSSSALIIPPDDDMEHPGAMKFFENKGQIINTDNELVEDIKYYTHRQIPSIYFTDDYLSYVWSRIDTTDTEDTLDRIDMSFVGSNVSKKINRASSQGGEYLNFYLAQCPDGVLNAHSCDRLIASEVYDNVDLEYYFDNAGLKYYIILKPGYSPQNDPISMFYDGADEVNILGGGELEIKGALGSIIQSVADAYQIDEDGDYVSLGWDADYVQIDDFEIGFDLGEYDDELPLVIEIKLEPAEEEDDNACSDVELENTEWGTFYGGESLSGVGSPLDEITDVKISPEEVDAAYICGYTNAVTFPDEIGIWYENDLTGLIDNFIQKFNNDGTLDWATYVGGESSEGLRPKIAVDAASEIIMVGQTSSNDFPTVDYNEFSSDDYSELDPIYTSGTNGYIFRSSSSGSAVWCTYYGGEDGSSALVDVAVADNFYIYVCGKTPGGVKFPYEAPGDAFILDDDDYGYGCITVFDGKCIPLWGTRFGGSNSDYPTSPEAAGEVSNSIAVDIDKNIIVVGKTNASSDFPTTIGCEQSTFGGGDHDIFISKFNEDYEQDWCTYYGGDGSEAAYAVCTDIVKDIYLTGQVYSTTSSEFNPGNIYGGGYLDATFNGGSLPYNGDAFLIKFDQDGTKDVATYYGGDLDDMGYDIQFYNDLCFMVGYVSSSSSSFPKFNLAGAYYQPDKGDGNHGFVAVFDQSTLPVYGSFIGCTAGERCHAIDVASNVYYIVGLVNSDLESDFWPLKDTGVPSAIFYDNAIAPDAGLLNYDGFICEFNSVPFFGALQTENIKSNTGNVYPNPTNNNLFVTLPNYNLYEIKLFNINGEAVASYTITSQIAEINVKNLADGMYFLKIQNEAFNECFKIQVIH